ncbi:alpha/beta fold hydrolase [Mucilaginibacter sp. L196]|uniref:alpha/beta fold hydrolase n=1 Tax=Mucilaginibacter sp. L196 TaxID=1641870 RepID=UPI00131C546C|nr:alpha/beta hydrolase [Mucilaginibacter sp. L196]
MYYTVNNVKLYVKDEGKGSPALLFLNFWGGSTETWNGVTAKLKDNFRCINYDHRGWGQSEKPETGYDIASLAKDALALIASLNLDDYVIVGHSMGGKVAQYIAARKPAGLRKLILVSPSPSVPTIMPPERYEGMKLAYTTVEGINATIDNVFKASDIKPEIRAQLVHDMQSHNESSRIGWPTIALIEDVSAGVDGIEVPTLIIAGKNDIVDPPERMAAEVQAIIAGSKLVVVEDAGHLSMLQQPDCVAELIGHFSKN